MSQVVNARRGMYTAAGRSLTHTGVTAGALAGKRLGTRTRLMPEEIFRQSNGDRDDAIRLLRQHGYLI